MILTCRSSTRSYEQHQPTHPCCRRVKCATNQLLDFTMVLTPVKHARYVLITIILSTFFFRVHHHHYHHQSLNDEGRWGTTDDFATSFLHFSLFSTALWDLPNSRPVHSLMMSSHLFLCLPCLFPPFTVPCKMVLARPNVRKVVCVCVILVQFRVQFSQKKKG